MFPANLRTAMDLKAALERAPGLIRPIGVCRAKEHEFSESYYGFADEEEGSDESMSSTAPVNVKKGLVEKLTDLYWEHDVQVKSGVLAEPFTVTITLPDYSWSGEIAPCSETVEAESKPAVEALLQNWFAHGVVAGFGDVRTQETRTDPAVRDAREFATDAFTVSPGLLRAAEAHWAEHFFPARVRAEPYKIHLYGPGGGFAPHRDTPAAGLVGTLLVGLGDTKSAPALRVGHTWWAEKHKSLLRATRGAWAAFYPDIAHEVVRVEDGYRAVIAFKIFALEGVPDAPPAQGGVQAAITRVLGDIPRPFGLLLAHEYSTSARPCGFDAALLAAARALPSAAAHLLPVLTSFDAFADLSSDVGVYRTREPSHMQTRVYPLTPAHVDGVLAHMRATGGKPEEDEYEWKRQGGRQRKVRRQKAVVKPVLADTEHAWISKRKKADIPFYVYTQAFEDASVEWRRDFAEGAEHTGNESRPTTEDSIYLSYALVLLNGSETNELQGPEMVA